MYCGRLKPKHGKGRGPYSPWDGRALNGLLIPPWGSERAGLLQGPIHFLGRAEEEGQEWVMSGLREEEEN